MAVTAAMAGGLLLTALPAQAATTASAGRQTVAAAGPIKVNINEMRRQSAELKAKAARLDHEGEHAAADRARAQARALDKKIKQYLDAEENA
ncbi:hypothetical protein [Streptomyces sp. NPDC054765]